MLHLFAQILEPKELMRRIRESAQLNALPRRRVDGLLGSESVQAKTFVRIAQESRNWMTNAEFERWLHCDKRPDDIKP